MSEPIIDPDFPPEDPVPPVPEPVPGEEQPVVDGWTDAPVSGDRVNVFDAPIVAGDPDGARIEIRSTGFHAFNGTGTETAHIDGAEGVFVGGSFRTSDALPGQVTLSDDAYVTHLDGGGTFPGLKVVPIDTTDTQLPAAIGPSVNGLTIFGGRNTAGGSSIVQANPTASFMRTFRADGGRGGVIQTNPTSSLMRTYSGNSSESGWVQVQPQDAELAYVDASNTYFSRIKADASEAFLYTEAGGARRYLTVDANGVWVKTNKSGSWKHYNLEETAQDSGWQSFAPVAGLDSYALAWRNKGGVIYMRGTVTATWSAGWTTVATDLPVEMRPTIRVVRQSPSTSEQGLYFRMGNDGVLEFNKPTAGTRTGDLSAIFYPAD